MKNNNAMKNCFICSRGAKIPPSGFCGQILKDLRNKKGVELKEVALACKMMYGMLRDAEDNNKEPHLIKIEHLAEFYGVEKERFYVDVEALEEKENKLILSEIKRMQILSTLGKK